MGADFNDAILQAIGDFKDEQRAMREEMNSHFERINGRLRAAEGQIAKIKAITGTLSAAGAGLWAIATNWDALKSLFIHKP